MIGSIAACAIVSLVWDSITLHRKLALAQAVSKSRSEPGNTGLVFHGSENARQFAVRISGRLPIVGQISGTLRLASTEPRGSPRILLAYPARPWADASQYRGKFQPAAPLTLTLPAIVLADSTTSASDTESRRNSVVAVNLYTHKKTTDIMFVV